YNQALNAVGDSEPSLTCTILCGISTLHRWQEQIPEAIAAAQTADRLARKHNIGMEGRTARLALWAACTHDHSPDEVLQQLDQIAAELEMQQERFPLLQALGLCAQAAMLASQPPASCTWTGPYSSPGRSTPSRRLPSKSCICPRLNPASARKRANTLHS